MAAVAKEMINMVNFFAGLPEQYNGKPYNGKVPEHPIGVWLRKNAALLCQETVPRDIGLSNIIFEANEGLFFDLYRIVIARRFSQEGWDKINKKSTETTILQSLAASTTFPGGDSIRLGEVPMDPIILPTLYGSLDDMNAAFICSGPYKLKLTKLLSQHLTLSNTGAIILYWDGEFERQGIPGSKTLMRYKGHTLASEKFGFGYPTIAAGSSQTSHYLSEPWVGLRAAGRGSGRQSRDEDTDIDDVAS